MYFYRPTRMIAPAIGLILIGLGRAIKAPVYALGADQFGKDGVSLITDIYFTYSSHVPRLVLKILDIYV